MIERYIQIRDEKAALSEKHAAEMAPYNTYLDTLETALQAMLNECGGDSIKTNVGTAYKSTATTAKVADWPSFIDFVLSSGDTELLTRNVNKTRYLELVEGGSNVPGIAIAQIQRVNVRRS